VLFRSNNGTNDRNDPSANSGLFVEVGDAITTSGAGAVGVFAQSIGGGGGVAGDIGATMQKFNIVRSSVSGKHSGNGGAVYATVGEGAKITTTGLNAPGMILQSIGGTGGWFANHSGAYAGSMGGTGSGAPVMVTVNGTVDAQGAASSGIIVQSTGGGENGGNPAGVGGLVSVTIGPTGSVWGGNGFGTDAASIYVLNAGAGSTINNYGVVNTHEPGNGYAVYVKAGDVSVTNEGGAYMTGNVQATNFINNGHYNPLLTVSLGEGTLVNTGTIDLSAAPQVTTLTGDYDGRAGSRIIVGADFAAGTADRFDVTGDATFAGTVEVKPAVLRQGTVEIARAEGTLQLHEAAEALPATLFSYALKSDSGVLTLTPQATFTTATDGLGRNREAVAGHLQGLWDGGVAFDDGFTALAGIAEDGVGGTLDTLSGQALGLIGATRYGANG